MKRNRNRAGWLKMAAASAVILSLGITAAFGMEAWLPAYDHKVLPLSKELLAAAPGGDSAGSELTLYPWNLYDKSKMSAVTDKEQPLLVGYIQSLYGFLYTRRHMKMAASPSAGDTVRLRAAFEKSETGGETLYFLKDQTIVLDAESCQVSCAAGSSSGILYVHVQDNAAGAVDEAALNKAVAQVRAGLNGEYIGSLEGIGKFAQLQVGAEPYFEIFSLSDIRDADVVATDKEILLVCTASKENAQLVLILDPLTLEFRGFSMQR